MEDARHVPVWLFALTVATIAVANVAVWSIHGDGEAAIRAYTTWTARISFTLFTLAFTASAVFQQWPNVLSQWIIVNRRYLGLSFAFAHVVHLGALSMVIIVTGIEPDLITIVFGGTAYLFVLLMALTSNDTSQRKLGQNWQRLHSWGGYYIWFIFAYTFGCGVFESAISILFLLIALASMGLKIQAKTRPPSNFPEA